MKRISYSYQWVVTPLLSCMIIARAATPTPPRTSGTSGGHIFYSHKREEVFPVSAADHLKTCCLLHITQPTAVLAAVRLWWDLSRISNSHSGCHLLSKRDFTHILSLRCWATLWKPQMHHTWCGSQNNTHLINTSPKILCSMQSFRNPIILRNFRLCGFSHQAWCSLPRVKGRVGHLFLKHVFSYLLKSVEILFIAISK